MADQTSNLKVLITAQNQTTAAFKQMNDSLNGLKNAALAVGSAIGGALSFKNVIDSTLKWGSEVRQLQRELGITAQQAELMNFAMQSVGGTTDELSQTFGIMNKRIADSAEEISKGTSVFDKYGIKLMDASGNIAIGTNALEKITKQFQKFGQTAQGTALLLDIFGRSGKELSDFLSLTGPQIQQMNQDMKDFGLDIGQNGIDKTREFQSALNRLNLQFEGLKVQLGLFLLPLLSAIVSWIGKAAGAVKVFAQSLQAPLSILKAVIDRLQAFAQQVKTEGFFAALVSLAQDLIKKIGEVLGGVGKWVSDNLPKWKEAISSLWNGMISWLRDTGWPAFVSFMQTQVPLFGRWILDSTPVWAANLGQLMQAVSSWFVGEFVPGVVQALATVIPKFAEWLNNLYVWFTQEALPVLFNAGIKVGEGWVGGVVEGLGKLVERVKPIFDAFGGSLNTMWQGVVSGVQGIFETVVSFLRGKINDLIDMINGLIGAVNTLPGPDFPTLPTIPVPSQGGGGGHNLAEGGIVTSRLDNVTIGEAGPEAVIPLGRGGGVGGVTIINNIAGSVLSENELVDLFNDKILRRLFAQRNLSF